MEIRQESQSFMEQSGLSALFGDANQQTRTQVGLRAGTEFLGDMRVHAEGNTFVRLHSESVMANQMVSAPHGWVFEHKDGQRVIDFLGQRKMKPQGQWPLT